MILAEFKDLEESEVGASKGRLTQKKNRYQQQQNAIINNVLRQSTQKPKEKANFPKADGGRKQHDKAFIAKEEQMPNFIDSKITHSETNLIVIQDNNFIGVKESLDDLNEREENQKEVKSKRKSVKSSQQRAIASGQAPAGNQVNS